jgi:hypothetical protein
MVKNDKNGTFDVFVRDRSKLTTICASLTASGATGNSFSLGADLSADGGRLVFQSSASDLVAGDTNHDFDIFLFDVATGAIERASVNAGGVELDGDSRGPAISKDGSLVAFGSVASNVHRDAPGGTSQIFVRDPATGEVWLASRGADGLAADRDCIIPTLFVADRPSGPVPLVLFWSAATNLQDAGVADADLFAADFRTGLTQCVNVDSGGGDHTTTPFTIPAAATADGSAIVFTSRDTQIVAGDLNRVPDVFLRGLQWTVPTEFGTGLAGTGGYVPHLLGHGGSCEAAHWSIDLVDGLPQAPGTLWVGFGRTNGVKLFGGTFYVDLSQPFFALPIVLGGPPGLGGAGELHIDGVDVGDLGQFSLFLQCTFVDAHAPRGVSLSNALELAIDA